MEAAQPHQPQEDHRGRGHVTQRSRGHECHHPRGQPRIVSSLCGELGGQIATDSSSDTRSQVSVRFRGPEVVGGSRPRAWSLARPRGDDDDGGRNRLASSSLSCVHWRQCFMTSSGGHKPSDDDLRGPYPDIGLNTK